MSHYRIPFNKPGLAGDEYANIAAAMARGQASGDGHFGKQCESLLQAHFADAARVLLTTSCTHALEMMGLLLNLQPGDEVIVPSFTFVSTVNAFVLRGAIPVFVDIRPDTLNIDERLVERALTPRTRAITVVHYAGVGCEMDALREIATRHGLVVLEDNAHGLFGRYKGRELGSFGALAAQSFHETKNVICGEGGALIINEPAYTDRAEYIREKGTNRSRFFRGQVDKYSWVDVGSSYVLSDLLAAFLLAQLNSRQRIQQRRQRIWTYYRQRLDGWATEHTIQLPFIPTYCDQAYHMFYLILPSLEVRQRLIDHLKARGILAVFHYLPLHLSDMGRRYRGYAGQCPVTESVSDRLLRLPFYNDLTESEQDEVIDSIMSFEVAEAVAPAAVNGSPDRRHT